MSEELQQDLIDLGLQRYVAALFNAGYDDWETVADMAESDFDALDIRLGDRRKLQREIARRQLWPENSPLPTPDELREFTLGLQDDDAEDAKNGFHHHISETLELMSPDKGGSSAGAESPFNPQDNGPPSVGDTSRSSDTIPTLQLDAEVNNEMPQSIEGSEPSHLSAPDANLDDDETPRALEARAVRPNAPYYEQWNCFERLR